MMSLVFQEALLLVFVALIKGRITLSSSIYIVILCSSVSLLMRRAMSTNRRLFTRPSFNCIPASVTYTCMYIGAHPFDAASGVGLGWVRRRWHWRRVIFRRCNEKLRWNQMGLTVDETVYFASSHRIKRSQSVLHVFCFCLSVRLSVFVCISLGKYQSVSIYLSLSMCVFVYLAVPTCSVSLCVSVTVLLSDVFVYLWVSVHA